MKPVVILLLVLMQFFSADGGEKACNASVSGDTLKILTWNVYMLPMSVYHNSLKKPRAHDIVSILSKGKYDILVLQETFQHGARKIISVGLKKIYPYQYGPLNSKFIQFRFNGGVYVLSKIPLKVMKQIVFHARTGYDKYAKKGAVLLEGYVNSKKFQIIGTHIQSSAPRDIMNKQFQQIRSELLDPYMKDGVSQIISGDMNTNAHDNKEYTDMISILDTQDGKLTGDKRFSKANGREIDYILLRNNHSEAYVIQRNVVIFRPLNSRISELSDHYGIEAEIVL